MTKNANVGASRLPEPPGGFTSRPPGADEPPRGGFTLDAQGSRGGNIGGNIGGDRFADIADRAGDIRRAILKHRDQNRPATVGEVAAALALVERLARREPTLAEFQARLAAHRRTIAALVSKLTQEEAEALRVNTHRADHQEDPGAAPSEAFGWNGAFDGEILRLLDARA